MKQIFSILALSIIMLSSCSTTKKAAQTPDDVYYSPGGHVGGTAAAAANQGEYYSTAPSDQYVRMRVQDPSRWSYFDDYNGYDSYYAPPVGYSMSVGYGMGYPYSPYGFGYGMALGPSYGFGFWDPYLAWDSYYMWNSWYNPYFYNPYYGGGAVVVDPHTPGSTAYSHLRTFNAAAYQNGIANGTPGGRLYRPGLTRTSYYNGNTHSANPNHFNNTNSSNIRNFNPAGTNSSGRGFQPARTYSPTPSSNSFHPAGGGGVGGGGGGGFRPVGRH